MLVDKLPTWRHKTHVAHEFSREKNANIATKLDMYKQFCLKPTSGAKAGNCA
jgi:hypothetical protein